MKILLSFSGGRDSLLAALRLHDAGHSVYLHICNNHSMDGLEQTIALADMLVEDFPRLHLSHTTTDPIYPFIQELSGAWKSMSVSALNGAYPNIAFGQLECLTCQTSMWIAGIIAAKKLECEAIATGYRKSQPFALQHGPMLKEWEELAAAYGLKVCYPVRDVSCDRMRKLDIARHGVTPKEAPLQCYLGVPADVTASDSCYAEFFRDKLRSPARKLINREIVNGCSPSL